MLLCLLGLIIHVILTHQYLVNVPLFPSLELILKTLLHFVFLSLWQKDNQNHFNNNNNNSLNFLYVSDRHRHSILLHGTCEIYMLYEPFGSVLPGILERPEGILTL